MTREIRLAGYPPPSSYPVSPLPVIQPGVNEQFVAANFVGGVLTGGGFLAANPYAIQFEADIGIPAGCGSTIALADQRCTSNTGVVSVINYELRVPTGRNTGGCTGLTVDAALTSPTLMRSQRPKDPNGAAVMPVFDPYVNNVVNCDPTNAAASANTPIFTYCPAPPAAAVAGCPTMAAMVPSSLPAPQNTRIVLLRLQTQTLNCDPQTGQFYNVEFFSVAQRVNPD